MNFMVNYDEVYYNYNEATGLDGHHLRGVAAVQLPAELLLQADLHREGRVGDERTRATLTTTAYASFGTGGGEAMASTPGSRLADGTHRPAAHVGHAHQLFEFGANGLNVDDNGERKGSNFIRVAHNDHRWYGALSNYTTQVAKDELSFSAGCGCAALHRQPLPHHWRHVWRRLLRRACRPAGTKMRTLMRRCGKETGTTTQTTAKWDGEAPTCSWSGTSCNYSGVRECVRGTELGTGASTTSGPKCGDPRGRRPTRCALRTNGGSSGDRRLVRQAPWPTARCPDRGATLASKRTATDWERLNSYTVKAGGNYNLNEWTSAYTNLGYLSRAPLFNSVFDINNNLIEGYENQYVKAVEVGLKYAKDRFASNINAYRTGWENKAVNRFYSVSGLWQDANLSVYSDTSTTAGRQDLLVLAQDDRLIEDVDWDTEAGTIIEQADRNLGYNLLNADAVHSGVEWDFAYDVTSKLDVQGVFSWGNWRWTSNERVDLINSADNGFITRTDNGARADTLVNLNGVKVGDAAQRQISASVSYRPKRGTYFSVRSTWFWQHYADFSPGDVITEGEPKDVWVTPGYNLINFNAGTSFDVSDNALLRVRLSVTNLLDELFIADARNNSQYAPNPYGPQGSSGQAEVFVGPPRMIRVSAVLELKGLQNRP